MTKSLKLILIIIGALGLAAGIYSAVTGSAFMEYFWSIFLGITLIGSAFISKSESEEKE
ncbi:MAG: hypothetical protein RIF46_00890 [Cyclobacteriaceae bacterium]